jgi:hypothetical protein
MNIAAIIMELHIRTLSDIRTDMAGMLTPVIAAATPAAIQAAAAANNGF